MYFNNKIDTDIDSEFEKKKFNLKLPNISGKNLLLLVVGVLLLIFGIVFFVMFNKKESVNYFLELNGEEFVTVYKGNEYIEPGYSAYDNKGNDFTNMVLVDNNVDTNAIGDYFIIYTLNDKSLKRYVTVVDKPIGATYIYLKGDNTIYLNIGEEYIEPGYLVIDSIDSDLTNKVVVYNKIDINKKGTYQIVYSVTNSTGVTTTAKRTVIVVDGNISLSLDNEGYTNKDVGINIYIMDNYFDYLLLPDGTKIKDKSYTYRVNNNGEYKFISYNKTGKGTEASITVNTIDREGPTGSCSGTYENGKSYVNVNVNDKSGISKYVVDGVNYNSNSITINKEYNKVKVIVYDRVGNSSEISCSLSKGNVNISEKSLNINSSFNEYSGKVKYYLYIPEKATENMPLIYVYPAAYGDYGSTKKIFDNLKLSSLPAFVYIPLAYSYNSGSYEKKMVKNSMLELDDIINKYKIDRKRISITGFSSSGTYMYYVVAEYRDYFAAMVPVSSGINIKNNTVKNNLDLFKTIPTKGYGERKGRYDDAGNKCLGWTEWNPVGEMTNLFKELGRLNDFTDMKGVCHPNMRGKVFSMDNNGDGKADVFEWMISQSK